MNSRMCATFVAALACLAAVGCVPDDAGKARSESAAAEARAEAERQRRLDAERARAEADQRAQVEQERRLAAEKQASDAATSKWAWMIAVALVGTVIGTAIRKKVTSDYIKQRGGR